MFKKVISDKRKYIYFISFIFAWMFLRPSESAVNLARDKVAWQSTTLDIGTGAPYSASKAVDGNKDTSMENGYCSHTVGDMKAWWVVNLTAEYCITRVNIIWRNKNSNLQNGAFLALGLEFNGVTFTKENFYQCAQIYGSTDGGTKSFDCSGIRASYVSVFRESTSMITIQMCEVEVYGFKGTCAVNLAYKKEAWASSMWEDNPQWGASKAVDGNKDTEFTHNGFFHSASAFYPDAAWLVVSLGKEYHITELTFTWRNKFSPQETLHNGSIIHFNYQTLTQVDSAQMCSNQNRALLSNTDPEMNQYVTQELARLKLNNIWLTKKEKSTDCDLR